MAFYVDLPTTNAPITHHIVDTPTLQSPRFRPYLTIMSHFENSVNFLSDLVLNEARFLDLLEKLIGESEFLQNSPPQGLIPNEDRASDHVLKVLEPYMIKNGGVLEVERVSFVEG